MPEDTAPLVPRPPPRSRSKKTAFQEFYSKIPYFGGHYKFMKFVGLLGAIWIATVTFSKAGKIGDSVIGSDWNIGGLTAANDLCEGVMRCIADPGVEKPEGAAERTKAGYVLWKGDVRPVIALSALQMLLLGISRCSAFLAYPAMILVFMTKFRATAEAIAQSPFGMFTYNDLHELHVYTGWMCMLDGCLHTLAHSIRWILQGNFNLIVESRSGRSGLASLLVMLIIVPSMRYEPIRGRVAYEIRKYLHYLFVVFCIAMSFHAPISTFPNGGFAPIFFPTLFIWWFLDSFYVYFWMTERISTSTFHVLPTGVQLTMNVSDRFQKVAADGGYCYINLPWISKHEWHAYSLYENPVDPSERQVFMMKNGNWTSDVLNALQRDTSRPAWICGPFSSPYDEAIDIDNQILVAGGIGITPALSVMRKHQESRRPNLIWACRDPHMLEFFCKNGSFSRRGWNMIFYTGKVELYIGDANEIITKNGAIVHIVRSRPNLANLIPNMIYSIESGEYVPEDFISEAKVEAIAELQEKLEELDEMDLTSAQKLTELMNYSNDLGFLFTDLMQEVDGDEGKEKEKKDAGEDGEDKGERRRTRMLSKIQAYTGGSARGPRATRMTVKTRKTLKTLGRSTRAAGKGRATVAWQAVDAGMGDFMDDFESYKPWEQDSSESREYVNGLDRKMVLDTWGCMYCGGQGPLATNLRKACKDFGLKLAIESFKW